MKQELMMLYGARFAVLERMSKGNCFFAHRSEDGKYQMVEYADVCNYLEDQIKKYNLKGRMSDEKEKTI